MPFRLPTKEEKADYVLKQFDRIARGYDLTNDAISMGMHRFWKNTAVDKLSVRPDGQYLDVCCGTGDLSLIIANRLAEEGKVVGLDFSSNMLDVARRRASKATVVPQLEWVQADAQQIPSEDSTFDGAIVSFGLRNLTDYQRGINEMARVVKPGGHVINIDLGDSRTPLFAQLFAFYFRHVVPIIGMVLQNDRQAYTYLPESKNQYQKPEGITQLFTNAGLVDVRHIPLALGSVALHVGTVKDAGAK
ncbi:MAG TPA: bifunctional demethylmenaquinone methyltransferase/2-methoxy-6-polyprenyl-1,4-benzoquinol methylase UbiE [Planktothrix sp.]|jgi:demethylmenaquinone methyltransferase/2-methoxy-6-polyprenyl-1,4-benzoquinol methylase